MLKYFQDMLQHILKEVPKKKIKAKKSRANSFNLAKGKTSIHPEILAPVNNEKLDCENVRHLSKIQKTYQILMQKFVNPSLDLMPQSLKLLNEIKKMDSREQQKMFASLTNILLEKNKQQKLPYPLLHFSEKVLCNKTNNDFSIGRSCQEKTKESLRPIVEFSTKNPNEFSSVLFNYKDVSKANTEKSNRFWKRHNKKLKKQKKCKLKRTVFIKSSLKSKKAVEMVEEIPNSKHHIKNPLKNSSNKNSILLQQNLVESSKTADSEKTSNNENETKNLEEIQNFNSKITCCNNSDKIYQYLKDTKVAEIEQNIDVQKERDSKNTHSVISLNKLPKDSESKNIMGTNTGTDYKNQDKIQLKNNKTFDKLCLGQNTLAEKVIKEPNIDSSINNFSNKKSAEHKCQEVQSCSVNENLHPTVVSRKINTELPGHKTHESTNIMNEKELSDGQTIKTHQSNLINKNKLEIYSDNRTKKCVETETITKINKLESPVMSKINSIITTNQSNKLRKSSDNVQTAHLESQLTENHLNSNNKMKMSNKISKDKLPTSIRNIAIHSQGQLNNTEKMSSNSNKLASGKQIVCKNEVETSSSCTKKVMKSRPITLKNDNIYEEHMNKLVDVIKDKIHINRLFLRKFKENFTLKTVPDEIEKAQCNKLTQDLNKNSSNISIVKSSKYLSELEKNRRNRSKELPIENTESCTSNISEPTRIGGNVTNKKLNRILKKDMSRKSIITNKIFTSLTNVVNEDNNPTSIKNDQTIILSKAEPLNYSFDKSKTVKGDVLLPGKTSSSKEKIRESVVKAKISDSNKRVTVSLDQCKHVVSEVRSRENNFQKIKNKMVGVGNKNNSTLMNYEKLTKNVIQSKAAELLTNDRSKVLKKKNVASSKVKPNILLSQFLDQCNTTEVSKNNKIGDCLQRRMSKKLVGDNNTKILTYKVSNDYSKKIRKLHSKRMELPHLDLKMYGEGKKHNSKTDNNILKTVQVVCNTSKGETDINKTALLPLVENKRFLAKTKRNEVVQSRDKLFPILLQNRNLCNVTNKANLIINYLCRRYTTATTVNTLGNTNKRVKINPSFQINEIQNTGVSHLKNFNSPMKIEAKIPLVPNNHKGSHEKTPKTTSGCKKREEKRGADEGNFGVKSVLVSAEKPLSQKNDYSLEVLYKRIENRLKAGHKVEKNSKSDHCLTVSNSNNVLNFTVKPKVLNDSLKAENFSLECSSLKKPNKSITAEDTVTEDCKRLKWKSKSERLNSFLFEKSGIEVQSFKKITLIKPANIKNNTDKKCSKVKTSLTNLNAPDAGKNQVKCIHDNDKRFRAFNSSQIDNDAVYSCHQRSKKEFSNLNFLSKKSMTDTTKSSQYLSKKNSVPGFKKNKPQTSSANKCISQCYSDSKVLTGNSLSNPYSFCLNRERSNLDKSTFTVKKPLCESRFCKNKLQSSFANQSPKSPLMQFLFEQRFEKNQETTHEHKRNSKIIHKTPVLTMPFKKKNDRNSNKVVVNFNKNSKTKLLDDSKITNQALHDSKFKIIKNNKNTGTRIVFSSDNFNIPPNILAQYYKNTNRKVEIEKEKPKSVKQWKISQHSEQLQLLKSGINISPKQGLDSTTKEISVQDSTSKNCAGFKTEPIFKQTITNADGVNKYTSLLCTSKRSTRKKEVIQEPNVKNSTNSSKKYIANSIPKLPINIINHNSNLIKNESLKVNKYQNNKIEKFDSINKTDSETISKTPIFPFCRFTNNVINKEKSKMEGISKDRKPYNFTKHIVVNSTKIDNNIKENHTKHPKGNYLAAEKEMKTDLKAELRFITGSSSSINIDSLPKYNKRKMFSVAKATGNTKIKHENERVRKEEHVQAVSKKTINFNQSKESTNKIFTGKSNKCIEKMFEYGLQKRINSFHNGLIKCSDRFKDSCKTKEMEIQPSKIKSFTMKRKALEKSPRPVSLERIVDHFSMCSGDISQMKKIIKSNNTFKIFRGKNSKKHLKKKNYEFVKDVLAKTSENKLMTMNRKKVVPKHFPRSESGRFMKKSHSVVEAMKQDSTKLKSSKAKKSHLSNSSRILSKTYIANEESHVKYNLPIPTSNLIKYCWSH